jgi:hypothetical protein
MKFFRYFPQLHAFQHKEDFHYGNQTLGGEYLKDMLIKTPCSASKVI